MEIQKIIKELINLNIIDSEPTTYRTLKGGTVSEVYLVHVSGHEYVIKLNRPPVIESESRFLQYYFESPLLPKLIYVEPSYRYMVYSFIAGSTHFNRKNKKEILKALVQGVINQYKKAPADWGWGWADQPVETWQRFILEEVAASRLLLGSQLGEDDHTLIRNLAKNNGTVDYHYFIHGDCGVHNFIFHNGELRGVIDPSPVIGDPLYDLIYAFCSSPDELTRGTIDSAVSFLNRSVDKSYLYETILIGLYLRLSTCIKHHPNDFDEYMRAWHYWKMMLPKE